MKDKNFGDSITAVEELLRRQDDFEKTVESQDDKFKSITRRTEVGSTKIF
jgi:spectrin beta